MRQVKRDRIEFLSSWNDYWISTQSSIFRRAKRFLRSIFTQLTEDKKYFRVVAVDRADTHFLDWLLLVTPRSNSSNTDWRRGDNPLLTFVRFKCSSIRKILFDSLDRQSTVYSSIHASTMEDDDSSEDKKDGSIALCASCDRCRARKTKCDGNKPCGNCATKYLKKHKLTR